MPPTREQESEYIHLGGVFHMTKKIFAIAMVATLIGSAFIAGCGEKKEEATPAPAPGTDNVPAKDGAMGDTAPATDAAAPDAPAADGAAAPAADGAAPAAPAADGAAAKPVEPPKTGGN